MSTIRIIYTQKAHGNRPQTQTDLFLKVDFRGETVRLFCRPEEMAERLESSGFDIPASEIKAGMELHFSCLVNAGQDNNGYKTIEKFLPEATE